MLAPELSLEQAQIIEGPVWARVESSSDSLIHYLQEALAVESPTAKYTKAARYGHWDGRVKFLRRPSNSFLAGLTERVQTLCTQVGVQTKVSRLNPPPFTPLAPELRGITLRPYQRAAVDEVLRRRRLALHAPTGSGKTECGLEIIRRIGRPTLWVTHSRALLTQTLQRLNSRLPGVPTGMIGDGRFAPSGAVVVGMVQSLVRIPPGERSGGEFWKQWEILILDEAHHGAADTWMEVAQACSRAWLRVGLSGTLTMRRPDPVRTLRIEGILGPVLVVSDTLTLARAGFLARPRIVILSPPPSSYPGYEEVRQLVCPTWRHAPRQLSALGPRMFTLAYDRGVIHNPARNHLLLSTAYRHVRDREKVLLLLHRIPHARILARLWEQHVLAAPESPPMWMLSGSSPALERETVLQAFRDFRGGGLLIATPFFREGVDVPEIDVALLGGGGESEVVVLQGLGRALRPRRDKTEVLIYDVADGPGSHPKDYLANHFQERLATYRAQGFEVTL